MDPGTRTLGQLLQERQWAVSEIERLRLQLESRPPRAYEFGQLKGLDASPLTQSQDDCRPLKSNDIALLSAKQLRVTLGICNATLYRWTAEGLFPSPIKLGARCSRWRIAEVRDWIKSNANADRRNHQGSS
jgi:prophage regulatory protein